MNARPDGRRLFLPEEARNAAEEAALLRLLGLLFERPRRGWAEEVRSLASEQADDRLRAIAGRALAATEGEYLGVFGPGGTASPREVAYRGFADPGRLLSGLSAIYEAFSFRPRAEDPADHIAVELGFVGYLAVKEAYTLTAADGEGTARTRKGKALFLDTHLRPFATGLRARLAGAGPPLYLAEAAEFLAGWAGCDAAGLGTPPVILAGGLEAGEGAFTCGGCGEADTPSEEVPSNPGALCSGEKS